MRREDVLHIVKSLQDDDELVINKIDELERLLLGSGLWVRVR